MFNLINLTIIVLIIILASITCYLITKARQEIKPDKPKQFSKKEIKKREGTYFNGKEV